MNHPYILDQSYLIRTVTFYYTGKLKYIYEKELVFSNAAWIANTGRFSDCLVSGNLQEIEPFPDEVIINRDAIIDMSYWHHPLPRQVK